MFDNICNVFPILPELGELALMFVWVVRKRRSRDLCMSEVSPHEKTRKGQCVKVPRIDCAELGLSLDSEIK